MMPNGRGRVRVLHLITDLDRGGAEHALVRLVARIDRSRFDPFVVALKAGGPLVADVQAAGVPVMALDAERRAAARVLARAVRVLRAVRPHVLQTWLYHADLLGLVVGSVVRVPAISWNLRCAELDRSDHSRSLFWMLRLLARLSSLPDAVVVNSNAGKLAHEAIGYGPRRWEIIPNGFDTSRYAPSEASRRAVRQELNLPDDVPVVGMVARFHPMKDHATFLDACARLRSSHPGVHFVLAGRLVQNANVELRTLVERHGLGSRVRLLGEVADTARLYPAFDIAVSSSYSEAFPNVVGEAMACGTPVVSTDAGDSSRIVGETGWIVPPRDAAALAAAVGQALQLEPAVRRARGDLARQRITNEFSLDRAVARYEALYAGLAASTTEH